MPISIESLKRLADRALQHGATRVDGTNSLEWDVGAYCDEPVSRTLHARGYKKGLLRQTKWADTPGSLTVHLGGLPCRKCDKCLFIRASQWQDRAIKELAWSKRTWFVTLTLNPAWQTKIFYEELSKKNSRGWRDTDFSSDAEFRLRSIGVGKLVTKWLKQVRRPLAGEPHIDPRYLCVVEKHKTGLPHVHLLVHETGGEAITYRRLEQHWLKYGFFHAKLVNQDHEKAASYVTKYATKSALSRIRASQRYGRGDWLLDELYEGVLSLHALGGPSADNGAFNPVSGASLPKRIHL